MNPFARLLASSAAPFLAAAPTPDVGNDPDLVTPGDEEARNLYPAQLTWLMCERPGCGNDMLVGLTDYLRSIATGTLMHCESCKHLPVQVDALFEVEL